MKIEHKFDRVDYEEKKAKKEKDDKVDISQLDERVTIIEDHLDL